MTRSFQLATFVLLVLFVSSAPALPASSAATVIEQSPTRGVVG